MFTPRWCVAVVATASLTFAACGDPGADEARAVLKDYWTAIAEKDGKKGCGALLQSERERLAKLDGEPCEDEFVDLRAMYPEEREGAARRAKATYDIEIDGKRAIARGPDNACSVLELEDGEWHVFDERCRE